MKPTNNKRNFSRNKIFSSLNKNPALQTRVDESFKGSLGIKSNESKDGLRKELDSLYKIQKSLFYLDKYVLDRVRDFSSIFFILKTDTEELENYFSRMPSTTKNDKSPLEIKREFKEFSSWVDAIQKNLSVFKDFIADLGREVKDFLEENCVSSRLKLNIDFSTRASSKDMVLLDIKVLFISLSYALGLLGLEVNDKGSKIIARKSPLEDVVSDLKEKLSDLEAILEKSLIKSNIKFSNENKQILEFYSINVARGVQKMKAIKENLERD